MWFAEGFWREVNLCLMSPHEPFLSCWVIWPQMGEIWALVCRLLTSCKALRCGFVSHESTQLLCPWASFLPGLCPPSWVLGHWAWQSCSALLAPCLCHSSVGGQGLGAPGEMFGQSIKSEYSDFIRKQIRLLTCLEQNLVWVKPSLQLSHFVLHKASPSSGEVLSSSWTKVQDCTTFEPNSGFDPHFKSGFLGWEGLLQAEPRVWTQALALPSLGSRGQHNHLRCCRAPVLQGQCVLLSCCSGLSTGQGKHPQLWNHRCLPGLPTDLSLGVYGEGRLSKLLFCPLRCSSCPLLCTFAPDHISAQDGNPYLSMSTQGPWSCCWCQLWTLSDSLNNRNELGIWSCFRWCSWTRCPPFPSDYPGLLCGLLTVGFPLLGSAAWNQRENQFLLQGDSKHELIYLLR